MSCWPTNPARSARRSKVSDSSSARCNWPMSALGHKPTYAPQQAMSAVSPIAPAKADTRKRSCLLYSQKRTCALRAVSLPPRVSKTAHGNGSNRLTGRGANCRVRYGSAADIGAATSDVCFTPESRRVQCKDSCLLSANSGHRYSYSITSSARASSAGGTVRPRLLAVLRLITSSYLVGACTGRSAGFSPLRMRSIYLAAPRH